MSLTEDQIERRVEKMVDHLDRLFLNHTIDQRTYDTNIRDLNQWAEAKLLEARIK